MDWTNGAEAAGAAKVDAPADETARCRRPSVDDEAAAGDTANAKDVGDGTDAVVGLLFSGEVCLHTKWIVYTYAPGYSQFCF